MDPLNLMARTMKVTRLLSPASFTLRAGALLLILVLALAFAGTSPALAQEDGGGEEDDPGLARRAAGAAACQLPGAELAPACRDNAGSNDEGSGDGGSGSESSGGGSGDESSSGDGGNASDEIEEPGGIGGFGIDVIKAVMGFIWDWSFGWFGERVGDGLVGSLLYLPDPTGSGGLGSIYDSVTAMLAPVLLVALLIMSLLMTLKAHNRGISYAGFSFLPRIFGVAIVLGALPFLMGELSKLGTDLTVALLPSGGEALTAGKELIKAILGQLVVGNIMNLILAIAGVYVLFVVAVVTFFKNIFYILLFIAAPFALVGSLVPGLNNFASAWAKGVLVCAAIPAMWAAELWLGSKLLVDPRQVFGEGADALGFITNGMFTSIIAIIMMWIMYKTPFKVLSWAFVSYDPHRGGGIGSFGKWMALSAGKQAVSQIAGAASNMKGSGADVVPGKGGSTGSGDGPRLTESLKQRKSWEEDSAGNVFNERTQYERTREMSEGLDANTVNMAPPQGHGPTASGTTPYAQPSGRETGGELGGAGPNSPTFYQNNEGRKTVVDQDRSPYTEPRDEEAR